MDSWSTRDLSLAAWLSHKLGDPTATEMSPCNRNWRSFVFDNSEECRKLSIEYLSSESHKFDSTVRALRKVILGFKWVEETPRNGQKSKALWSTDEISFASFAIVQGAILHSIRMEEKSFGRVFYRFSFSNGSYSSFRSLWTSSEARLFDEQVKRLKRA